MATEPLGVRVFDPPGFELVRGVRREKVSPARRHARVQAKLAAMLLAWGDGRGEVTVEWDIDLTEPGAKPTHFRPDIAYASHECLAACTTLHLTLPRIAPELIVEVRSPSDRESEIAEKIAIYLAQGTEVVIDADPETRTFHVADAHGLTSLPAPATFVHPALPGLRVDLDAVFPPLA